MAEDYLESLDELDYMMIDHAISSQLAAGLRNGQVSELDYQVISRMDEIIGEAPPTETPIKVYVAYKDVPELRGGGKLTDDSFILASTSPQQLDSERDIVLEVEIPSGTCLLNLEDEAYVLRRHLTLSLEPTETGVIPATITTEPVEEEEAAAAVVGEEEAVEEEVVDEEVVTE